MKLPLITTLILSTIMWQAYADTASVQSNTLSAVANNSANKMSASPDTSSISSTDSSISTKHLSSSSSSNLKSSPSKTVSVTQKGMALNTQIDKVSYTLGYDIGENFKAQDMKLSTKALTAGIKDSLNGTKPIMTQQQMESTLLDYQKQLLAERAEKLKKVALENKEASEAFLTQNKKQKDVISLPSGLQYKVITSGNGPVPKLTDTVTVDYTGTLIDGKEFDSSYKHGQPGTFPLSEVIAGWQEALTHMNVGATWMIYIPSELAYGDKTIGSIGPNQALIFKVHLIDIAPTQNNTPTTAQQSSNTEQTMANSESAVTHVSNGTEDQEKNSTNS